MDSFQYAELSGVKFDSMQGFLSGPALRIKNSGYVWVKGCRFENGTFKDLGGGLFVSDFK